MKEDILQQIESSYQLTIKEENKEHPFAMIIDGKALQIALGNDIRPKFLRLAVSCAAVICCRVSPKQKALVGTTAMLHLHTQLWLFTVSYILIKVEDIGHAI